MIGLKAEWPAGMTVEAWPNPLPDLYAGEPVVLSAKLPARRGELHLSGVFDGKPWTATLKLEDAVQGAGVPSSGRAARSPRSRPRLYTDANPGGIDKQSRRSRSRIIWYRARPACRHRQDQVPA